MENSKIGWTDHTFNPWIGCTKVSDGCKHCYAETLMDKRYGRVKWGPSGTRERTSDAYWKQPVKWNRKAEAGGRRYRVFCASLADVFEHKPDQAAEMKDWRTMLFCTIDNTPHLDWLLLTKRPENVAGMLPSHYDALPANAWIGTSVENQETADERIPHLLKIPARVRFLSCEPLLGPIDLSLYPCIDWVIIGGESHGINARPLLGARDLIEQCDRANIPVFVKQLGSRWAHRYKCQDAKAADLFEWPSRYQMQEFPRRHIERIR